MVPKFNFLTFNWRLNVKYEKLNALSIFIAQKKIPTLIPKLAIDFLTLTGNYECMYVQFKLL